jgi:PAS domain S-box-containing protein
MTLMDNIPDSVYFKDERNRFILVNKAKAQHSNVSPEDMIGRTDFDFIPDPEAQQIQQDDNEILTTGHAIINKVEKITHADGSIKWISVTKIPRYNAEGDIIGTMGISRDITDQEYAKEELMKSEARYRAVFENSSFSIVLTNEDHKIVSWNHLVEDLLNMKYEDLYMKPVQTLYPPEEWDRIQQKYAKDDHQKQRIETKIMRKDHRVVDVDLSVNVLKSEDGKILGSTEIISDISKRKQTEKELERQHELLSTLMENIPDSVYFKDKKNQFILVNNAKAEHSHVTTKEMIGKTDYDFLADEEAKQLFSDDTTIQQSGTPIINKIEKITYPDGTEKWMSVTKIPRYNKHGEIIGTMGISRDVTDWKKAELRLARQHELLHTLMESTPDSIYFKDAKNRFILVNRSKAEHWGVSPKDMTGKTDYDFLPHDEAKKAFDDDNLILKTGKTIDKIEKITGSDGLERWFSVVKVPRYDKQGNIIGTMGISRNVTEWKKLQDIHNIQIKQLH